LLLGLLLLACEAQESRAARVRAEAVTVSSGDSSAPSLHAAAHLAPAVSALRARSSDSVLRVEIHARKIVLQAEDPHAKGSIIQYVYAEGRVQEPQRASLRGRGELEQNLFPLSEVALESVPALVERAVRHVDASEGRADYVLIRRNLPESDDVRIRVYVSSPRRSGYLDADARARPLLRDAEL
jgi:hypothetical protein